MHFILLIMHIILLIMHIILLNTHVERGPTGITTLDVDRILVGQTTSNWGTFTKILGFCSGRNLKNSNPQVGCAGNLIWIFT